VANRTENLELLVTMLEAGSLARELAVAAGEVEPARWREIIEGKLRDRIAVRAGENEHAPDHTT